jgi:hypothetical protein
MERSRPAFEAQESFGTRVIFRSRCTHRLPCEGNHLFEGERVHSDGIAFADELGARSFALDRAIADECGQKWHVFVSWDQARDWLLHGCGERR